MPKVTPPSQTRWKAENVVSVKIDISRNADPDLYDLFCDIQGSRGSLARELLREALEARKAKETPAK